MPVADGAVERPHQQLDGAFPERIRRHRPLEIWDRRSRITCSEPELGPVLDELAPPRVEMSEVGREGDAVRQVHERIAPPQGQGVVPNAHAVPPNQPIRSAHGTRPQRSVHP